MSDATAAHLAKKYGHTGIVQIISDHVRATLAVGATPSKIEEKDEALARTERVEAAERAAAASGGEDAAQEAYAALKAAVASRELHVLRDAITDYASLAPACSTALSEARKLRDTLAHEQSQQTTEEEVAAHEGAVAKPVEVDETQAEAQAEVAVATAGALPEAIGLALIDETHSSQTVSDGTVAEVRAWLESGGHVDSTIECCKLKGQNVTTLMLAAGCGHMQLLDLLIGRNATIDLMAKSGHSALLLAVGASCALLPCLPVLCP